MNKSLLKSYAPRARKDFIRVVEERAALLGLNPNAPAVVETEGNVPLTIRIVSMHKTCFDSLKRKFLIIKRLLLLP